MALCRATKANGEPCKGTATGSHGMCWAHAPENAEQRRKGASKGGKAKPNREIKDLKGQLAALADDVLEGRVDRGDAITVNQIINTRARLVEIERKIRVDDELEERLSELEDLIESKNEGRRYGAAR